MKIFAAVLLAVSLSAGAAQAKMMHKMHMVPACADGMAAKATCVCKASMGSGHAMCKKGMWCHTFSGTCSM